jgi:serine protein kinase
VSEPPTERRSSPSAREEIAAIAAEVKRRWSEGRRVLSFDEFLLLFEEEPRRHTRDASRYLADCIDHFGQRPADHGGALPRYRLFDLPFDAEEPSARSERLIGHEEIQHAFRRGLANFEREGRVNRLLMLHGPNGSAKSTFVHCLMRGLEHYATLPEGASYFFSWIFPRGKDGRALGFGSSDEALARSETFAHLPDGQIDLRIASELRESPLLLLPAEERKRLVRSAYARAGVKTPPPALIERGQLGAKNRLIFDALLTAYRGDLRRVLAHVRIERSFVSMRYRQGAVTIGPQVAVDASERQITVDRSLAALPASLASVALFEASGELVEASGGLLEYSDMLKRPLDAWKYLLLAIEEGEVALSTSILPLNTVLVATSNDVHLEAFRGHHEYKSFRGRLSFVRVPYLVDRRSEQAIYDAQIVPRILASDGSGGGHVTPHATFVAALWAVLTRLERPSAERYASRRLGAIAAQLTPLEKSDFYAGLLVPHRLSTDEAAELRAGVVELRSEHDEDLRYEGQGGASPREIRVLLLDAAQDRRFEGLSPLAVLDRIEALVTDGDHDFLKRPPEGGYHDHRALLEATRQRWLDLVDDTFRRCSGLVEESQYVDLFDRYVTHVSYWLKKERVPNPVTGRDEPADTQLMESVEAMLGVSGGASKAEEFRRDLINVVAGHAIDHPGTRPSMPGLFPRYLQQLREATYGKRRRQLAELAEDVVRVASTKETTPGGLDGGREARAQETLAALLREGYTVRSARDVITELQRRRYT